MSDNLAAAVELQRELDALDARRAEIQAERDRFLRAAHSEGVSAYALAKALGKRHSTIQAVLK